jgi:peptidoglycan hydrolase-like protein with peptidoglycan-binding domain
MFCKRRTRTLVIGLLAFAVFLCVPSAGLAKANSADLLAPGAGYASPEGSQPVRDVQRLLRRLGDGPGPIDGLYGPLTTQAVQRFQEAHALAVDGVVGPHTMGRLVAERKQLRKAKLERKSPARGNPAESVTEQPAARTPTTAPPDRAKPESSTGRSPWLAAAVGALALALLLVVVWRLTRRRRNQPRGEPSPGPRLGLVCAALLAAYAIGAATGALFASHATPDQGAKPSTATAEPRTR